MFKNAMIFTIPPTVDLTAWLDSARPVDHVLKPVGPMEISSVGFVPPVNDGADPAEYAVKAGDYTLITVGTQVRRLPGSAVDAELAERVAKFEAENGRKLGRKLRRQMRDDIMVELLPRALVVHGRLDAYIDHARRLLVVNTPSPRAAEMVVGLIRAELGSFPALPLNAEVAPRSVLTDWLANGPAADGLGLGEECELRDPAGESVARIAGQELHGEEIETHLQAGKQAVKLQLYLRDQARFTVTERPSIVKFKLLDGALQSLEQTEREDLRAEIVARLFLTASTIGAAFDALKPALKFSEGGAA